MTPPTKSADELDGTEPRDVALPILVEAHGGRLYSLGMRFCGNWQEAEDLVQETFLQAYRKWDQFEGRSKPSTWLYTIASRICQRMHRKRSGEPDKTESLDELLPFGEPRMAVAPAEDDPLSEQIRREGRERIEEEISALPALFRQPLVLRELAGFSMEEIAAILDVNPATVKTRIHRARLKIRKALEDVLPRREVPPPAYSKTVCLDLLQAKQESLDNQVAFEFPDQIICERCAEVFATMDLTQSLCGDLLDGELPQEVQQALLARLEEEG